MGPQLSTEAELAPYPPDIQQLIHTIEQEQVDRFNHYTEDYSHSVRGPEGYVTHYTKSGRIMDRGPIHAFFELTYASWLVLPRVSLQEMPTDWQARFVALLEEGYARGLTGPEDIFVTRRGRNGLFASNGGWDNYRHGNVQQAQAEDLARGIVEPEEAHAA